MEENRQAAVVRAETEEERRHRLRLQNLAALKEQIFAHETAKVHTCFFIGGSFSGLRKLSNIVTC